MQYTNLNVINLMTLMLLYYILLRRAAKHFSATAKCAFDWQTVTWATHIIWRYKAQSPFQLGGGWKGAWEKAKGGKRAGGKVGGGEEITHP